MVCIGNCGILDASAELGYSPHGGQCQPGTHKNPGAGAWKRKDTEITGALSPCCQWSQHWEVEETEGHSRSHGAATSVQQPASATLDSPSCPLHGQHHPYKSRRKEKEELSNPEHLYPWAVALQQPEKEKGSASTVLGEGVVPVDGGEGQHLTC